MKEILTTVLLLNPVYVTLFWAIVLHLDKREGNVPKLFFGKAMVVIFVLFLSHFFFFTRMHHVYIWLDCFYNLASLSLYPMYYVYARLLTTDEQLSVGQHGRYFIIPLSIFVIMAFVFSIMSNEQQWIYVTEVLYGKHSGTGMLRVMYHIYVFERIVFIVQMVVYVILTSRLVTRHHKLLNESYSSTENLGLRWVQVFNVVLLLTSLGSAVSISLGRENLINNFPAFMGLSLSFTVYLFTMGVMVHNQNPVILRRDSEPEVEEVPDDKIPPHLKDDLIALFEKRHVYLDKDLTIWDLTEKLGTNRTYVSKIINKDFGLTFKVFVNNYRVDHAIRLLNGDKHYTVEEISEMSGFGSSNSLYRAFLAKEGTSLTQYRSGLPNNNRYSNGKS